MDEGTWANRSRDHQKIGRQKFPLLEKSTYIFSKRAKHNCASCHHTTLTSMAAEIARQKGIPVLDALTKSRVAAMEHTLKTQNNPNLIDNFITANFVPPYILLRSGRREL